MRSRCSSASHAGDRCGGCRSLSRAACPDDTNFLNTCAQAMEVIRQVNHPHFKLHMDVKAQSSEVRRDRPGADPPVWREAGHFHAQDVNLRGPGMGDVDFGPIMKALVEAHYDRWVSVEVFDFSPGAAKRPLRRSIDCLKGRSLRPGASWHDRSLTGLAGSLGVI